MFDLTIAPPLLFYAYIPIILIVGFFAMIILMSEKASTFSKLFFGLAVAFILWIINVLVQWTAVSHMLIYRSWQATAFFEMGIIIFAVLLMYAYVRKTGALPKTPQIIVGTLGLATLISLPFSINISTYDFVNCEGVIGQLWYGIYGFEIIAFIWVGIIGMISFKKTTDIQNRFQIAWFTLGLMTFIGFFSGANIYGEITQQYSVNLVGPIGMILFVGVMLYLTVKYKILHLRLLGVQALVYTLLAFILALLFVNNLSVIHWVVAITGILMIILGSLLIKSVRRETDERNRLEQVKAELEQVNTKLKDLDATKNEFLSFATHQLRSPLTSIKWGLNAVTETLIDKHADADSVKIVSHLATTTDDLISTVNDLLDISKIEQGGLVMKSEDFDIYDMTARITEEFKMTAQKKNLTLKLVGDVIPCMMHGDQTKLRQVIVNMIDNAIKYTAAGNVTVSFIKKNNQARIEITDTGPGISPEELGKLFYKFTRGVAGKASQGGSGLGLYLAKKIVEMHQGTVGVTSEGVGKGSTFFVELPVL
jgi:signal transduction histidine kinase